ncbi:hypothetical protein BLNAU_12827 [Blattamonas nauphoetae]|uniref:Uncharacterized protein n=1 Tax=Blattamonas nauphoetae TaxID=2049346 RepID=A0ABQ9XIL6_9EUKA|nr:hypothetical protein BLNAU_12827 [Blattamonas nauphoetae]
MQVGLDISNYCSSSLTNPHPPTPLLTLPPLTFTDPSHFSIDHNTVTRTEFGRNNYGGFASGSAHLSDPFTSGIVSITISILSNGCRDLTFGLMDSNNPIPKISEVFGLNIKNSVCFCRNGQIWVNTPSSSRGERCSPDLYTGACVRMEVDLDSTPRTVQFFVNGETMKCYVFGADLKVYTQICYYSCYLTNGSWVDQSLFNDTTNNCSIRHGVVTKCGEEELKEGEWRVDGTNQSEIGLCLNTLFPVAADPETETPLTDEGEEELVGRTGSQNTRPATLLPSE